MSKNEITKTDQGNNGAEMEKIHPITIPSPKDLYGYLDAFVIGQNDTKKVISVAIYNHYKRFLNNVYGLRKANENEEFKDVVLDKSNVLMHGPTGSGKTYMIKTICKFLGIPCYIADATKLTESGFVGDDVETILTGLLHAADGNVKVAEHGVCLIDEADKLGRRGENPSLTRDVGGEGVQQGLLKIVEGTKIGVPPNGGRKHPEQQLIEMDTSNILFIAMGAFVGLDKIVDRRINKASIGFASERKIYTDTEKEKKLLDKVTQEDLKKFGLIPELIGRFPVITHTNELSEDELIRILTEPKNSIIKQYRKLLDFDGVDLRFNEDALRLIAKVANNTKTGARGLRSILEMVLTDIMFEYGGTMGKEQTVIIDYDYVYNSIKSKYDVEEITKANKAA